MSDGGRTSQIDDPVGGHTTGPIVVVVDVVVVDVVVVDVVVVDVVVVDVVVVVEVVLDVVLVVGGVLVVATATAGTVVTGGPGTAVVATDDAAPTPSMSDEQPTASSTLAATAAAPIGDRTARLTLEV
jgi:hypothetical protein